MDKHDIKAIENNPAMRYKRDIQGHCRAYTKEQQAELKATGQMDELIQSMLPMAMRIASDARESFNKGAAKGEYEWDDLEILISVANEALIKAVRAWDPDKGAKASTYVYQSVRRDVVRFLYSELDRRAAHLSLEQEPDSPASIGDETDGPATNAELLSVTGGIDPAEAYEQKDMLRYAWSRIDKLTDLQRIALTLYLEAPSCEGNYAAVAEVLGTTRQAAKQLIDRALTSVRATGNISVGDMDKHE